MSEMFEEYGGTIAIIITGLSIMSAFIFAIAEIAKIGA